MKLTFTNLRIKMINGDNVKGIWDRIAYFPQCLIAAIKGSSRGLKVMTLDLETIEVYDKKKCTELLFKKYQNTLTLHKTTLFEKNCKNIELDYSMELCQKAFGQFFLGVKEKTLKKRFGPQIMNCFTKSQLEKVRGKKCK